jgi:choline dehydrogenase
MRGSARDYDGWGLDGWTGADVLPWFVAAEANSRGASPFHGSKGLMQVENPRYESPLHDAFFAAAAGAGLERNEDFNDWSRGQAGYGEYQVGLDF